MTPRQVELFGYALVGLVVAMPFAVGLAQVAGDAWRAHRRRRRMRPPF